MGCPFKYIMPSILILLVWSLVRSLFFEQKSGCDLAEDCQNGEKRRQESREGSESEI
jgi:hypothetical protein